jgi:ubiquinone/menaquinone biosynthesis C-methylase UbiE
MKKNLPSYSKILFNHIIKPYNLIVDTYTDKHFGEKIFIPLLERFTKLLPKKAKILDAGCGPGGETQFLMKKCFTVTSIDVAPKMLEKAKQIVPHGNFMEMNIADLDFKDKIFDGIWSARTLIHIPSEMIKKILNNFYRVLKPRGIICITVLTGDTEEIEPEYYDPTNSTTTFFHYFKAGALEKKIEEAGFKVIDVQKTYLGKEKEEHYTVYAKK